MATARDFDVTPAPQDLLAALSLSPGVRYSIQNIDPGARVFARVQDTAPSIGDRANVIPPFGFGYPTAAAGEGIWVWTPDPGGSAIMVNEA